MAEIINEKKILLLLLAILFVGGVVAIILALPAQAPHMVPIQSQFENKIVYGVGGDLDVASLEKDCQVRGGNFNTCGNVCAPDAGVCIQVCAYTCEFANKVQ